MSKKANFSRAAGVSAVVMAIALSMAGARSADARQIGRFEVQARSVVSAVDSDRSADRERMRWDDSGTIGRMGLGADPYRPEGPGNFGH